MCIYDQRMNYTVKVEFVIRLFAKDFTLLITEMKKKYGKATYYVECIRI